MIIEIKHDNIISRYGTWLPLNRVNKVLQTALKHNRYNFTHPYYAEGTRQVFKNIIDELDFLEEFDRGYTINKDNVEATYELFYHNNYGLMFELISKFRTHPERIMLEE